MTAYAWPALVLSSWLVNAIICSRAIRHVSRLPEASEADLVARYDRWGRRQLDFAKLASQLPQMEAVVPGLRYIALVPLAIAAAFGLNALAMAFWFKDRTAGIWLSVGLTFLPVTATILVLAWEQRVQLARLQELAQGPTGIRMRTHGRGRDPEKAPRGQNE